MVFKIFLTKDGLKQMVNTHYTLTRNPFSNTLKCIYGVSPELDWKEISMKTLEGGKEDFGERGKIYHLRVNRESIYKTY